MNMRSLPDFVDGMFGNVALFGDEASANNVVYAVQIDEVGGEVFSANEEIIVECIRSTHDDICTLCMLWTLRIMFLLQIMELS